MNSDEYIAITDALPPAEAQVAFNKACLELGVDLAKIDLRQDVIVDTIRSTRGMMRRYKIRKELLKPRG
jgi:hypothetical protein